jgi:hypothetical protein
MLIQILYLSTVSAKNLPDLNKSAGIFVRCDLCSANTLTINSILGEIGGHSIQIFSVVGILILFLLGRWLEMAL